MLTDFPGLYNLHAQSEDGKVTEEAMLDTNHENHPDFVLMVADASSLQGQLFLVLQVRELGIPCMLLLNCIHTTGPSRSELRAEARRLESALDLPVRVIDASKDKAGDWVRSWAPILSMQKACAGIRSVPASMVHGVELLRPHLRTGTPGFLCHLLRMREVPAWLSPEAQEAWRQATTTMDSPAAMQLEEAGERMGQIKSDSPRTSSLGRR